MTNNNNIWVVACYYPNRRPRLTFPKVQDGYHATLESCQSRCDDLNIEHKALYKAGTYRHYEPYELVAIEDYWRLLEASGEAKEYR